MAAGQADSQTGSQTITLTPFGGNNTWEGREGFFFTLETEGEGDDVVIMIAAGDIKAPNLEKESMSAAGRVLQELQERACSRASSELPKSILVLVGPSFMFIGAMMAPELEFDSHVCAFAIAPSVPESDAADELKYARTAWGNRFGSIPEHAAPRPGVWFTAALD